MQGQITEALYMLACETLDPKHLEELGKRCVDTARDFVEGNPGAGAGGPPAAASAAQGHFNDFKGGRDDRKDGGRGWGGRGGGGFGFNNNNNNNNRGGGGGRGGRGSGPWGGRGGGGRASDDLWDMPPHRGGGGGRGRFQENRRGNGGFGGSRRDDRPPAAAARGDSAKDTGDKNKAPTSAEGKQDIQGGDRSSNQNGNRNRRNQRKPNR